MATRARMFANFKATQDPVFKDKHTWALEGYITCVKKAEFQTDNDK